MNSANLIRLKLLRTLFTNLLDRFSDDNSVLAINIVLQALDDIILPLRSNMVSKNNKHDFHAAIDYFLNRGDCSDKSYIFYFPNVCERLSIDYKKLKPMLEELLLDVEKELENRNPKGKENKHDD